MLFILQRYYFESESQQYLFVHELILGCCLSYKDTILKANHNEPLTVSTVSVMLFILQRYYFESESQQLPFTKTVDRDVVYPTKILF